MLFAFEVGTANFREVARVDLVFDGLPPTALHGFADGRVLLGFTDRVDFVDLQAGTQEVLHDLRGQSSRSSKAIDAFAWNGGSLLVAVDDILTPKWMVNFDVSLARRPTLLGTTRLPDGVNEHNRDALFLDTHSLVLLSEFGHMGGRGSILSFLSLDTAALNFTAAFAVELMEWEAEEGTTWVGPFSRMRKLEKSTNNDIVIAAEERGLVIIPAETQRECFSITNQAQLENKLKQDAKRIKTKFPAVNVRCRQNMTVVLQVETLMENNEESPSQFHISIYNSKWEEVHTSAWPYQWSDGQDS